MASFCLSTSPTLSILPIHPSSSSSSKFTNNFTLVRFRNSTSTRRLPSLSFSFNPLRSSLNSTRRLPSLLCMSSSADNTNEPLWNSLGKSIENFGKKPSVEELLRQQIEKQEYYDEGGGGGNRAGGKGGGGGGGGGDGLGGSDEESFAGILDETIQVILATLGFIFMYVYIINGAEMTRLAKDYMAYLFGGRKSIRLTRAMDQWERFWKHVTEKEVEDKFWLEKAILLTPTWWDSPEKYKLILKAILSRARQPKSDANEEETTDEYGSQANGEMGGEYY